VGRGNARPSRWVDEWMGGRVNGYMGERVNGWMSIWVDEWIGDSGKLPRTSVFWAVGRKALKRVYGYMGEWVNG